MIQASEITYQKNRSKVKTNKEEPHNPVTSQIFFLIIPILS